MSASIATKRDEEIIVTNEQLDLVKKTVASGATDAELRLFLYDCQRRGVHPLDRLLHFTKRGGKYVPIVSIDLMRSRAAETCEYAGNDDAEFDGSARSDGFTAKVTVYRLVQGQRCAFSATARWSEYCPPSGQDTMWKKMPHTMLAKVAESLALRKGFPQQIGGLYSGEEMAQAGEEEIEKQECHQNAPSRPAISLHSPAAPDAKCETEARKPASDTWHVPDAIKSDILGMEQAAAERTGKPIDIFRQFLNEKFDKAHPSECSAGNLNMYKAWLKGLK